MKVSIFASLQTHKIFAGLCISAILLASSSPVFGANASSDLARENENEKAKEKVNDTEKDKGWVRIAVVAASSQGMGGDKPLRFAYRDGERLEKMLGSVGQIAPENLFLLKVEGRSEFQAGLARIGERIRKLKDKNHKVFLQFYYSGHGGARTFHFKDGGLDFSQVKEALGGDRADARVYVLDVCFGASFFTAKGFRTAPPVQLQLEMDRAAKGEVTISSSSGDEQAYEVRTLGGSIFTSHWIMALRGAGDVNRDGQVTLFEAYNYAYDRTAGYSAEALNRPQHPSYQIDLTGARDVMLARLLKGSTGILFQKCPAGLYNLLDLQRGIQIGELRIPEGDDFTLALEPGHYRVQYQPPKGKALGANLDVSPTSMTALPFKAFSIFADQTPGAGISKGSELPLDSGVDPVPDPSFTSKLSFSGWYSLAGFKDGVLESRLVRNLETDAYFGFSGGFVVPFLRRSLGMEADYSLPGNWLLGLRVGYSSLKTEWNASGIEPLHSVADSLKKQYPVQRIWSYKFSDFQLGGVLGRTFKVTETQSIKVDGAFSFLSWQVTGEHRLDRPLYQAKISTQDDFIGSGYRVESGATYLKKIGRPGDKTQFALGFRLAPYFQKAESNSGESNPMNLASHETGLAATLSLNLF